MANLKPLVPNRESGSPWPTTTKHQRPATSDQRMTVLYAVLHAALDTGTGQSIWASQSARHHYPPDTNATPPSVIPSSWCLCCLALPANTPSLLLPHRHPSSTGPFLSTVLVLVVVVAVAVTVGSSSLARSPANPASSLSFGLCSTARSPSTVQTTSKAHSLAFVPILTVSISLIYIRSFIICQTLHHDRSCPQWRRRHCP